MATALDGHSDNPKLTAQMLVETADTLTHRWFTEDDGNLTPPEIMKCELRCMLSAYLVATNGAHVQQRWF